METMSKEYSILKYILLCMAIMVGFYDQLHGQSFTVKIGTAGSYGCTFIGSNTFYIVSNSECGGVSVSSLSNWHVLGPGGVTLTSGSSSFTGVQMNFTQPGYYSISVDYTCTNTGSSGTAYLPDGFNVYAAKEPKLEIKSDKTSLCSGPIRFTAEPSNTGTDVAYKWFVNGVEVTGEVGATFKLYNVPYNNSIVTAKMTTTGDFCLAYGTVQAENSVAVTTVTNQGPPPDQYLEFCDFQIPTLSAPLDENYAKYNWFDENDQYLGQGPTFTLPELDIGSYTFKAQFINRFGCTSNSRINISVSIVKGCDDKLNSIESISFSYSDDADDEIADSEIVAHSKNYFDYGGNLLQSQSKSLTYNKILTSEVLIDKFGRPAVSSLPAPINSTVFQYERSFVKNVDGKRYTYEDFENPVGKQIGTLGHYYSTNNDHIPVSDYPYARTEFYDDGTGEVKRVASPGDQLRLGQGRELLSGTFPVYNELNDYLLKRLKAIPGIVQDGSLTNEGVQTVVRDQNGKFAVSIADKSGKAVMSARKGTLEENALVITNQINLRASSSMYQIRFYILDDQHINIASVQGNPDPQYFIEDLLTGLPYAPDADGDPEWEAGFYRFSLYTGNVEFTYKNYFLDISYQFYDDAGRLKASLSPNGYAQLGQNGGKIYNEEAANYATDPDPVVDLTYYQYNFQGWLLTLKEPDAGTSKYQYRKDGKIRFSQNALQRENASVFGKGKFSYTHYDYLGRPIESGEYKGSQYAFGPVTKSQLELAGQIAFVQGDVKDWVRTHYDTDDHNSLHTYIPEEYKQGYLRGAVSWSENANIKTWYSYDEFGRVVWMAQKPTRLNRTFVTQYTYDFLGNVLTVRNLSYVPDAGSQNFIAHDQFYHHYEYDKDQRLKSAYTSTDGSSKKLRATYEYYLHGPLKRIVLGDKLQGIDFVYNIHGWLTQINHPDQANDPGGDGSNDVRADVFGMVLDYYESDLGNLYLSGAGFSPRNLHGLPDELNQLYATNYNHQPLIRFNSIEPYEPAEPAFKQFSAENPRYKKMLSETLTK